MGVHETHADGIHVVDDSVVSDDLTSDLLELGGVVLGPNDDVHGLGESHGRGDQLVERLLRGVLASQELGIGQVLSVADDDVVGDFALEIESLEQDGAVPGGDVVEVTDVGVVDDLHSAKSVSCGLEGVKGFLAASRTNRHVPCAREDFSVAYHCRESTIANHTTFVGWTTVVGNPDFSSPNSADVVIPQ